MEIVAIIVIAIVVLAYYGFMKSAETIASIGNREVAHLEDVHSVSIIERTAALDSRISEDTAAKAAAVKAKIKAMREEA